MKLADALRIINAARSQQDPSFRVVLCSGFTPLHLATFLQAHLQQNLPQRRVELTTGLFSDLIGNLARAAAESPVAESLAAESPDAIVAALEWQDLEPRLGYRQLGGWKPSQAAAIVSGFEERLRHLESAVTEAATHAPVILAAPSLPLPPAFMTATAQASPALLRIQAAMASCMSQLASLPRVKVANPQALDRAWAPAQRFDLKSDLLTGFPYVTGYAAELGGVLAACVSPRKAPLKGIITDLDDTLWHGLAGELGAQGLSWSLDHHTQLHGLYQQLLASLAEQGVLIAVASKNDSSVVEQVFSQRSDLLLASDRIFPREVHWRPKSESVASILKTWNIGADSVVFIDDSPIELGEVQAAHPAIECFLFPKKDYAAALDLLFTLRDRFGRDSLAAEDAFRLDSIRQSQVFLQETTGTAGQQESFLSQLEAEIRFSVNPPVTETRILELVNKTNQFNLNGLRYNDAEWSRFCGPEGGTVIAVAYQDRFGPLGTIAVAAGKQMSKEFHLRSWVMSCRAFSRRIEHRMLQFLFEYLDVDVIHCDYQPTPRNGPLSDFAASLLAAPPSGGFTIRRSDFDQIRPALHQRVTIQLSEVPA